MDKKNPYLGDTLTKNIRRRRALDPKFAKAFDLELRMLKREATVKSQAKMDAASLFELLHGVHLTQGLLDHVGRSGKIKGTKIFKREKYAEIKAAFDKADEALSELYSVVGKFWGEAEDKAEEK